MSAAALTRAPSRPAALRFRSLRALRHPAFRRLSAANFVSTTGTWMQLVAQNWVVLQVTGSTTALGATVALQAAPAVALGLWGGAVADRTDKRRLLMATQALLAIAAVALAVAVRADAADVRLFWGLAVLTGLVSAFDAPAAGAFSAELVEADELANAAALGSAVSSAGRILGMSLAGTFIALWGPATVFALNAASYLVVIATLAGLRRLLPAGSRPCSGESAAASGVRAGVRHVRSSPELAVLMPLAFALAAFGRNFQVTMAAMTEGVFGLGPAAYGVCSTAFAAGALGGAVVATRLGRPTLPALLGVAGTTAGLQAASAFSPGLRSFAGALAIIAVGAVIIDTLLSARVQLVADAGYRARALAVLGLAGMAGAAVGAPVLGWLADTFGARSALALGGVVAGLATVAAAARSVSSDVVRGIKILDNPGMAALDQIAGRPDGGDPPARLAVADLPLSILRVPPHELRHHHEQPAGSSDRRDGALALL